MEAQTAGESALPAIEPVLVPEAPVDEPSEPLALEAGPPLTRDDLPHRGRAVGENLADEKRCTAMNKRGTRCGAPRVNGGDKCAVHSGILIPAVGTAASAKKRREAVRLRTLIAPAGVYGPRAALRLEAMRNGEALAKRVVEEALAEGGGVKGAILALRAIEVADPAVEVTANVELPADPEAIGRMSLRELEMLEARGLLGATEGATASAGELEQAATPDPA